MLMWTEEREMTWRLAPIERKFLGQIVEALVSRRPRRDFVRVAEIN